MLHYLRVEEVDGRRLALDARPGLVDPIGPAPSDTTPTKFDDAGWHVDAAVAAGQPEEHAWTHIAFYLTWLIRHDQIERGWLRPAHVVAVKSGAIVDRDVLNLTDFKLVSHFMTARGASFSEDCYDAYTSAFAEAFSGEPDYSIPRDAMAYARVEPVIDRLWSDWLSRRERSS